MANIIHRFAIQFSKPLDISRYSVSSLCPVRDYQPQVDSKPATGSEFKKRSIPTTYINECMTSFMKP